MMTQLMLYIWLSGFIVIKQQIKIVYSHWFEENNLLGLYNPIKSSDDFV